LVVVAATVAAAMLFGCRESAQIRSYTVAKEASPPAAVESTSAAPSDATDRMLSAILPAGEQAWFFKVVGPIGAVDKHAEEITSFYTSIRLDESGRPRWTLPSGWKEDPPRAMRAATFWVPTDDKPLEISVTALPWRGTEKDMIDNVNRWRGQLKLPEIDASGLAAVTRELPTGDAKMTLVDLRGQFQGSGMAAPFAPFAGRGGGGTRVPNSANELPAGHPPVGASNGSPHAAPAGASSDAKPPKYDVPQSWEQRTPTMSMRKAEFIVADGQKQAVVTLIDFPLDAGPKIADPLENVNMWREGMGLGRIDQDALPSVLETLMVDGKEFTLATLIPDTEKPEQSQLKEATLAAMVRSGDRIWFVKMKGDRELVAAQRDQFETFVKSFRFAAEGGENHGN
jgi:hypothetical protein